MGNTDHTLVIILAAALAFFLLLAIIALVKIIQILNHLKTITEKAEKLATTAESVGEFFKHAAGPAAVTKLVFNVVESFKSHKKSKENE